MFIKREIIASGKAVSLALLTELYGQDKNNRKHRQRLKERILKVYLDFLFLSSTYHSPEIVVASAQNISVSEFAPTRKYDQICCYRTAKGGMYGPFLKTFCTLFLKDHSLLPNMLCLDVQFTQ